jgi:hypothetical protein
VATLAGKPVMHELYCMLHILESQPDVPVEILEAKDEE